MPPKQSLRGLSRKIVDKLSSVKNKHHCVLKFSLLFSTHFSNIHSKFQINICINKQIMRFSVMYCMILRRMDYNVKVSKTASRFIFAENKVEWVRLKFRNFIDTHSLVSINSRRTNWHPHTIFWRLIRMLRTIFSPPFN